jgi:hypothetical protein
LSGYIQPVELRGPAGIKVSIAEEGTFGETLEAPLLVGMNIGPVYRMRVTNIPFRPGVEVYPSLEVIDRLFPPVARTLEFPIPVDLSEEDLGLAASGFLVTRVIYVEDPQQATPVVGDPRNPSWFDVPRGEDPLAAAMHLGRPVAILRIGSRVPDFSGADAACLVAPRVTYFEPPRGYPEDAQP